MLSWIHWSIYLYCFGLSLTIYTVKRLFSNDHKNSVKYYMKFFIYLFSFAVTPIAFLPLFALRPRSVKNSNYFVKFFKNITYVLGVQWELRRGEILAEDRGCVVVANHQSTLDALGVYNIWHVMDKCATIMKKSIFYFWPFGLVAYLAGTIFLDRANPKEAHRQLHETTDLMVQDKVKIWMFPEGTRNKKSSGVLPFKRGAFKLAIEAQVPIVPVIFSPYYFVDDKRKHFGRGRVIITCLDAIDTKGMTLEQMDEVMGEAREAMAKCFNEVSDEVLSALPASYPLPQMYSKTQ